jgi:very-short-patch-repair endonuclease
MYDHDVDRRIERMGRRQCGAFNHQQALDAGASDDMISVRLRLGVWLHLESGVYAVASYPGSFERQCWAAVLGQPQAAVAGFAAAHLLGFRDYSPGRPEVVVPPAGNARSPSALVHRYESPVLVKVGGLKMTSRAQTIFDIASRVGVARLERTVDDEIVSKRMTVADLEERLAAYDGTRRKGLRVMRLLIADRRAEGFIPPASELERRADRIVRRLRGKPRVVREASFPWLQHGAGRVDRYLPDEGIIVEFDGRRWHTRVADFDRDRWRDAQAIAEGLAPLRFTYAHVTTQPAEVLDVIERARRSHGRRAA